MATATLRPAGMAPKLRRWFPPETMAQDTDSQARREHVRARVKAGEAVAAVDRPGARSWHRPSSLAAWR
jgi:hypothetical protein